MTYVRYRMWIGKGYCWISEIEMVKGELSVWWTAIENFGHVGPMYLC